MIQRLVIAALVLLSGCTMAPTKTTVTEHRGFEAIVDKLAQPLEIGEQTVVLDTRSSFDYGLNRVQGAIYFPWSSLAETATSGEILKDLRQATLRLSLVGVTPKTSVVVVGDGPHGSGEEGRLAWTLLYLGVKDVQVAGMETLRKNWTQAASPPAKNVSVWTAQPNPSLVISREEFKQLAKDHKGRLEKRIWLLDVRSEKEYFNQAKGKATPDVGALSVPWKEFFTPGGRPNPLVAQRLAALGIRPEDRVILLSQRGVRSSAAAYALIALGFSRVQNFVDGWRSIL